MPARKATSTDAGSRPSATAMGQAEEHEHGYAPNSWEWKRNINCVKYNETVQTKPALCCPEDVRRNHHLRTRYENTPGKVAATSENNLQKASHKSSKIVENSHLDTTRVPDTHFDACGGPEEATPLRKSMKIDDTLQKSTDIGKNIWKYCFPFLRRI